jgi:hypothetical protein
MRKNKFYFVLLSSFFYALVFFPLVSANAEVSVNIAVPLPRLVIPAPPPMLVIPGTYVYYPPDIGVDIFFYRGRWYRPYEGRWFIASGYNGPWRGIGIERVPRPVIGIPPGFRRGPVVYERVPYRDVRTHWRGWERERHWDRERHEGRPQHREDMGKREHGRGGSEHERRH